jgi:tetratricopeptide (TPR) repeat protein
VWFGLSESPDESVKRAVELAQKALTLDDTQDSPHSLLGNIYLMKRQYEKAIAEAQRGVALNPNGADAHAHLGMTLNFAGRRKEAIATLEKAIRLNPFPPNWYVFTLGDAYCLMQQYEDAIAAYQAVLRRDPDDRRALIGLAAAYGASGRPEEARAQAARILRIEPTFSLEYLKTLPSKESADAELYAASLRVAGLK